jgi:predicted PurR-regulated permease PerM
MKHKLNKNLKLLIVACLLFIIIVYKLYKFYIKEQFNTLNDLVSSSNKDYEKTRNKILKNTNSLVKNINPFDIDTTDSNEILNKYINKHLLDNKKSVVPKKNSDLSNDSIKTIQLIKLNELKLILEKINRMESIQIDENKK